MRLRTLMIVLPSAGIYLSENGTTLAIKPYWKGAKNLPFLKKLAWDNFTQKN